MNGFYKLLLYATFFISISNEIHIKAEEPLTFVAHTAFTTLYGVFVISVILVICLLTLKKKDNE